MSNNDNRNPYGPPPGPPGQAPQQAMHPHAGSGQPQPHPGYGPPPQPGYGPMQPYAQQPMHPGYGPQPMQYGPHPGYGPAPLGYGMPAPINIVVQNTNTVNAVGGLVRVSNKSRGAAAVLALLLGGFGAHKFYLGQPILGVLYLCMCWTFLPAFAGFIEGVALLCTSDHAFDMKYNARLT